MRILVRENVDAFAKEGAEIFARLAKEAIEARGRFTVALTGGSTPGPIHHALAKAPQESGIDWSKVELFFGDERAVAPDAKESNYGAAREQLLRHVPLPEAQIHRMEGERKDLSEAAGDYQRTLLSVCKGELDLVMLGVGKDAHILSLFPGSLAIDEDLELVVAEIDPPMNPAVSRITMTPAVLARARHVLVLARGDEKRRAVRIAIEGALDRHSYPAQILRSVPEVTWLLDSLAAADLQPTP
jgi:6-phosphogluconolactonase